MNQKNDLSLSLSGDAFSALRSDFDQSAPQHLGRHD